MVAHLSHWVSNNRNKAAKAMCSSWLNRDLLNLPSNSSTNIASGIKRYFQKLGTLSHLSSCIGYSSVKSNAKRCL